MSTTIALTRRGERGFTAIEMLIATGIMVVVTAATFSLMDPAQGTFATQPEVSDMQQRLRIAVETLKKDLLMAGAGTYSGTKVGTLGNFMASIQPTREGALTPDGPGVFKCLTTFCESRDASDTITLMYVPPTVAQTTIRDAMPPQAVPIKVNPQAGCPADNHDQLCGFKEGMTLLIFDESGTFDTFRISSVQDEALQIRHQGTTLSKAYDAGSFVTQVRTATYYLKTNTTAETYQLMFYDGDQVDIPIAENIVGLAFEYFGDPAPPAIIKPVTDPKGPWTNYGPKPPAVGVDNSSDNWGAGENCLFSVANGQHVARAGMATPLGPINGPLVKLTEAMLTDGPWCPDSANSNRYDADLMRIRKVRVTLRVQVAAKHLRGEAGALFLRGGTSRSGQRYVPDQEISFEVTPRNLNFGR